MNNKSSSTTNRIVPFPKLDEVVPAGWEDLRKLILKDEPCLEEEVGNKFLFKEKEKNTARNTAAQCTTQPNARGPAPHRCSPQPPQPTRSSTHPIRPAPAPDPLSLSLSLPAEPATHPSPTPSRTLQPPHARTHAKAEPVRPAPLVNPVQPRDTVREPNCSRDPAPPPQSCSLLHEGARAKRISHGSSAVRRLRRRIPPPYGHHQPHCSLPSTLPSTPHLSDIRSSPESQRSEPPERTRRRRSSGCSRRHRRPQSTPRRRLTSPLRPQLEAASARHLTFAGDPPEKSPPPDHRRRFSPVLIVRSATRAIVRSVTF
ncbi:serine/arginine repetitive matrix protein 1-like [Triticum aestivum]|uniref:serine/arginine repetitive matrix protein 1-like n=1 Tax=Triticum aestivum TaxID=4565 RepID=UPI001D013E89|nr:serine/arginine repetitive matrix protein 1-like [Triticum aestivum]